MALLARNFINSHKNPNLSTSQGNPIPSRSRRNPQNLHDYGIPNSQFRRPSQNGLNPSVNRSLENPTERPKIKDNGFFNRNPRNNRYNDYGDPQNRQPSSNFSEDKPQSRDTYEKEKDLLSPTYSPSSPSVDWFHTPIFSEFQEDGIMKYNHSGHQMFFDEEEVAGIYRLLKARYSTERENKKVEGFFHKAMDTLAEILGSFLLNNVYRAIRKIYTKSDVQNTMKLVLRVKSLISARYILFQIFQDIQNFNVSFRIKLCRDWWRDLKFY